MTHQLHNKIRGPQAQITYVFRKVSRTMRETLKSTQPEQVHQFRTSIRRIRSLAGSLGMGEDKSVARFERTLERLFSKAGKVRDIDVQIAALNSLTLPSVSADKAELLDILQRQRIKRARKLTSALEEAIEDDLSKRQRRAKAALLQAADSPERGKSRSFESRMELIPLLHKLRENRFTEETLHGFRLEVKHLRYTAEAGGASGQQIAAALKPLQDAIGEWHDWLNLYALAEKKLVHAAGHPILSILRAKVSARFAQAQSAIRQAVTALSRFEPKSSSKPVQSATIHPIRVEVAHAG